MSEPEGFLERWSRRKQEAEQPEAAEPASDPATQSGADAAIEPQEPQEPKEQEPEFDLSTLPSIESITAGTDIRAFLSAGVPQHLTRAALRRAWSADPAIRDYIGLSENSWDFNNPGGLHGFGPLTPADDVRRMVSEVFEGVKQVVVNESDQAAEAQTAASKASPESGAADTTLRAESDMADPDADERLRDRESGLAPTPTNDGSAFRQSSPDTSATVAVQSSDDREPEPEIVPRRRHGSALPT